MMKVSCEWNDNPASHANNYEFLPAVKIAQLAVDICLTPRLTINSASLDVF